MKYLKKQGANIHVNNEETLWGAAENGHLSVVSYLEKQGANIQHRRLMSSVRLFLTTKPFNKLLNYYYSSKRKEMSTIRHRFWAIRFRRPYRNKPEYYAGVYDAEREIVHRIAATPGVTSTNPHFILETLVPSQLPTSKEDDIPLFEIGQIRIKAASTNPDVIDLTQACNDVMAESRLLTCQAHHNHIPYEIESCNDFVSWIMIGTVDVEENEFYRIKRGINTFIIEQFNESIKIKNS